MRNTVLRETPERGFAATLTTLIGGEREDRAEWRSGQDGAAAGLDLCLHLIRRDHGAAVAADASRIAVTPLHRTGGQAQFIVRNPPTYSTAMLENVLVWIEENAHRDLALSDIAVAANISVCTLNRRFHAETGQSPMEWVRGVRIRHAQELLETTDRGIERIARHVGFASPSNFRTHFRRIVGVTPNDYRSTFTGKAPVTVAARDDRTPLPSASSC